MSQVQRPEERPFGVPSQRTPVQFDAATGGLRIGVHERRVDPSQPSSVYNAYLSLLYSVRGAKPGQQLPLRAADLEALLLIVGDDPDTIEQRLVGLMGCTPDEARALSGILLRHRKLTATLGIAAVVALGAASVAGGTDEVSSAGAEAATAVVAAANTDAALENRRPIAPEAAAPTAVELAPAATTPVVVTEAAAPPPAPAPARVRTTAPRPAAVAPAPVAPAPAPVVAAPEPVVAAPIDAAPAPAPADDVPAPPVIDAPPPVDAELPDADIGDPAFEEAPPPEAVDEIAAPEEIGGIADPSIGHDEPVARPDVALPFPNAPRVDVVIAPGLVAPVEPDSQRERGVAPAPDVQPDA